MEDTPCYQYFTGGTKSVHDTYTFTQYADDGGDALTPKMIDGMVMVDMANGKMLNGMFKLWRGKPKKIISTGLMKAGI